MSKDMTTSAAAKVCRCSQQTIIRAIDRGLLAGYRLPGSRHRRVRVDALHKYLADNGMPTEDLQAKYDLSKPS